MEIISGKINKAQKALIYGVEGIGKSTFASKFPEPLFIDTEDGTNQMDVKRVPTPTSWAMLIGTIKEIKANPRICRTLIIDTLDWAEKLCITHMCGQHGWKSIEDPGYGKGFTMLSEEFGRFLNLLTELTDVGIHVVLVAHANIKQTELPEETGKYEFWTLKLEKKTAPLAKEWADLILFVNYKTMVVQDSKTKTYKAQGGQRFMYTAHRTTWDAKNRHNLPEELELDYKHIAHIFDPIPKSATVTTSAHSVSIAEKPAEASKPSASAPAKKDEAPKAAPKENTTSEPKKEVSATAPASDKSDYIEPNWSNPPDWKAPPIPEGKDYLKPLYDLMEKNKVSDMMVRAYIAHNGNNTLRAHVENYREELVNNIVATWDGFFRRLQAFGEIHTPF
jgi:hypothetical protein